MANEPLDLYDCNGELIDERENERRRQAAEYFAANPPQAPNPWPGLAWFGLSIAAALALLWLTAGPFFFD